MQQRHWRFLKNERGNYFCSDTAQHPLYRSQTVTVLVSCLGRYGWHVANLMPGLSLTCAGEDWLVVLPREQGTGLDLSGAWVQVHGGRCRNTRPIFALHPGAHQIRNTAVYQDADVLERGMITGALIPKITTPARNPFVQTNVLKSCPVWAIIGQMKLASFQVCSRVQAERQGS